MRKLLVLVLVALAIAGCGPKNTPEKHVWDVAGDGVYIVGDEITPGYWTPMQDITLEDECVWFVQPATDPLPGASPTREPSFRESTIRYPNPGKPVIYLHAGETFTTNHCGLWVATQEPGR